MDLSGAAAVSASLLAIGHDLYIMQHGSSVGKCRIECCECKSASVDSEALDEDDCQRPRNAYSTQDAGLHLLIGKMVAVLQWLVVSTLTYNHPDAKGTVCRKGILYATGLMDSDFMDYTMALIQRHHLTSPIFVFIAMGYILSAPVWTGSIRCRVAERTVLTSCWISIIFAAMVSARLKASILETLLVFLPYTVNVGSSLGMLWHPSVCGSQNPAYTRSEIAWDADISSVKEC